MDMSKTAILVDGGFYRKRATHLWGKHTPEEAASALFSYCMRHLSERKHQHELYRIFYYDCPPIKKQMYHPLLGKTIDLGKSEQYAWMTEFLNQLKMRRKVALRLGSLDNNNSAFYLKYDVQKKLCAGTIQVSELGVDDFEPNTSQISNKKAST